MGWLNKLLKKTLVGKDGKEIPGHLNASAGDSKPAVIVVHDFFGLTDWVRETSDNLASEGFVTFAADLYRGQIAGTREEAEKLVKKIAWNRVALELGLAIATLRKGNAKRPVAVMGFAMGGAAALVAAAYVKDVTAAVTFYGIPQDVFIESSTKIQGHFATVDAKCTPARVKAFEKALNQQKVPAEFHRYEASNGFFTPGRKDVYSAKDAALAWKRSVKFLRAALV